MSTRFITRVQSVPDGTFTSKDAGIGYETSTNALVVIPDVDTRLEVVRSGAQTTAIGLKVTESGGPGMHQTKFTFSNFPLTVRDTQQGGGVKIYDYPIGYLRVFASAAYLTFTTKTAIASTLNSGVSCRYGVGSTTQANATLATTEQDMVNVTTFTSGTTIDVANTAASAVLTTPANIDGTGTAVDAYMNVSVPTNTDIDGDAIVWINGTVHITWCLVGTYSLT